MSVCGVVALNWLYASMLHRFNLEVAIFVDNWSWSTDCHEVHTVGMAETVELVRALRLRVDWAKAFAWAASKEGEAWWRAHGPSILPAHAELHLLRDARDLGAAMTYRGRQRMGCVATRLSEGGARLKRLSPEPRSVKGKARLIQTSVWPAAFYGAESHCIGQVRLRRLRGFACRALVGPHAQASPYLALGALCTWVQDPEAYLLTQALRTLQRLCHAQPQLFRSILDLAAQASGSPGAVRGPATALKALLSRNDWSLSAEGVCKMPGNYVLRLATASKVDIARVVANFWSERVRKEVAHRNGLHAVGVPHPALTAKALGAFPPLQQKVLARHVVGAFQSAASKRLWLESEVGLCPACGAPEDKWHRFVECSCFQEVRARHAEALHALQDLYPHWVQCPFATRPDEVDILNLVFATRPPPAPHHAEANHFLFTDGTSTHPKDPIPRQAAWAVISDDPTTKPWPELRCARPCRLLAWPSLLQCPRVVS